MFERGAPLVVAGGGRGGGALSAKLGRLMEKGLWIDDFVNVRSNNYELNEQLLKKAGVL